VAGPPTTGGRSGSGPLQVLFWQAETPLPLLVGGEEAGPTTLIIQEVYLGPGAHSQSWPAPGELGKAGAAR
jgi:hypothetical protein